MQCNYCSTELSGLRCKSCELYNAACFAQNAAAMAIARANEPKAEGAWLNEFGVFAFVDGVVRKFATSDESAPFVALTSAARAVVKFSTEGQD